VSAATLTGTAFGADTTGTGTNHLITATNRARDTHEDTAERHRYTIGVTMTITILPARFGVPRRMICDHVDHFLFRGACQVRNRTVHGLFLDVGNFLQRQIRLTSIW